MSSLYERLSDDLVKITLAADLLRLEAKELRRNYQDICMRHGEPTILLEDFDKALTAMEKLLEAEHEVCSPHGD